MATIAVFGTLDTKATAHQYIAEFIRNKGHTVLLVDASLRAGDSPTEADVSRDALLGRTGAEVPESMERRRAATLTGVALRALLQQMHLEKRLDGVISVGGRCGMWIAAEAIKGLPFGLPCVLATHVPEEAAEVLSAVKDVTLLRCVIKPVALNRVVRPFLKQAAGALCGMIEGGGLARWMANKPLILASQLASEQRAFDRAKRLLERAGYDVVVFKQKPGGGHPLESAIASGSAVGVLDLSAMEIAEDVIGCGTGASKTRLEAAGRAGLPSVVAPGGIDSVSLKIPVPPKFRGRVLLESGPGQMLFRSTAAECREIGRILALKLNRHLGPVTVCLPLRGLSRLSSPGQPFHDPDADKALFDSLESHLRKGIRVIRVKTTGEETPFLETCARALLMNLKRREKELPMLRSVEFLKEAPQLVLREAARLLQHLSFVSGEWVAPKHGIPDGLYFVLDGTIEVLENDSVVGQIGPDGIFGELELVFGRTQPFRLRSMDDSEVLFLGCEDFERLSRQHPELEENVAEILKHKWWE